MQNNFDSPEQMEEIKEEGCWALECWGDKTSLLTMSEKQQNLSPDLERDVLSVLCSASASAKFEDTADGNMPIVHSS